MPEILARPVRPWALRLLPPFPAVASRILALVADEDVSTREIGDIIKLDPTFTAEVLRIANSALFGVAREVRSVSLAVPLLGLNRVKTIATLIALNSMVKPALKNEALRKVWVHSLVTAIVAEECARLVREPRETCYTAGLLHNLGTLGLMAAYPEEYARMIEISGEHCFDLLQTETDLFEIDHCAAGAFLAQEWNFPDEISAAIATHHDEPVPGDVSVYGLIQVSWRLTDALGYGAFPADKAWSCEELLERLPGAELSWLGAGVEEARGEIASRLAGFGF